jgi:hypothetical protein
MNTRRILFFSLFVSLGTVTAGCAGNSCQDVVDAAEKASKVSGCESLKQEYATVLALDPSNCTATDEQATQYEAEATCLNAVTSCDAAGAKTLGICVEEAFSR